MAGLDNDVHFNSGMRIEPVSAQPERIMQKTATGVGYYNVSGDPEGVVSANVGSFATDRSNGHAYLKESGTGNTGWSRLYPVGSIVGGPGVTITESGGNLIVNSVVYTDEGSNTSVISDSGSFATAAVTLTLPASPSDGERCEFVATNGVLTIQAAGTQVIHIAGDSSSAGGTATGTATGDSVTLVYQASTDDWWSQGAPCGVWVLA